MLKELDKIIETCGKGKQISNFELRSIISSLAANLREVAVKNNSFIYEKKPDRSDEQLMQMKSQLNKKFQSFASESIPKYIREQVTQLEKKVGEYLTQERNYVISMEQKLEKIDKKPENSGRVLEKQLTKKIQQEVTKLKSYLNQQLNKIKANSTSASNPTYPINPTYPSHQQFLNTSIYKSPLLEYSLLKNNSNPCKIFNTPVPSYSSLTSMMSNNQSIINASNWVDPCCRLYKNIIFNRINLSDLQVSNQTLVLGKQRIQNNYQFILENKKSQVEQIGVSDASYNQMLNLNNLPNKASFTSTGQYNIGKKSQNIPGGGYQQGQRVTMNVDIKTGTITWIVGSNIKFQKTFQKLKDSSIVWVPFVMMGGSSIMTIKQSKTY